MSIHLRLVFGPRELIVTLPAGEAAWPASDARRWLDEQFTANECEPLRAMGKVLTADKVVAVAMAIGHAGFEQDETLRLNFARATCAALGRKDVRVDVDAGKVTY
jgi:hypothetical protein